MSVFDEYAQAMKEAEFMRRMIPNLVANLKIIVALAAAAQLGVCARCYAAPKIFGPWCDLCRHAVNREEWIE